MASSNTPCIEKPIVSKPDQQSPAAEAHVPPSSVDAAADIEEQNHRSTKERTTKESAFESLGWLDRFLAVWIFLAMAVGIILGNFVPNTGPALQKGTFVGLSIPIGKCPLYQLAEKTS
jgi:ACR3 family arsenite transporter